ncbi:MAG: class I SAM-dependent methyltransferase [Caldilineaceae bacterium]|jgi:SAM-dependent methyltransferase|nr:class I SAM-dependent methyltransferase [Caldilineaceae bacterium]
MHESIQAIATFDRFARFYDDDYRNYDDDIAAIAMLAEECDGPILELGCGTGRVLLPLAAAGHRVTGVDISPALLARAAAKLNQQGLASGAQLVEADLRTCDLPQKEFAFAFCTSNTLMHFTTAAEQTAVLRNAARHLRPGGRLLVDLFNPDLPRLFAVDGLMELADRWQDVQTGAEVLKWSVRTLDLAEQRQETLFIYEEIFADGCTQRTACPFTLRFLWRSEAELMLQLAGLLVEEVWGDFEGAPYAGDSEHLILIAIKPEA